MLNRSKEDKDIVFCSKDECASYDENWPRKAHTPQGHHDSQCEQPSSGTCGCSNRAVKNRLAASEKENNYFQKGRKSPPVAKQKLNVLQKKVSDRLIAPTVTSLAKSGNLDVREKPKPYAPRPNPEQAVCALKFPPFGHAAESTSDLFFILHHLIIRNEYVEPVGT